MSTASGSNRPTGTQLFCTHCGEKLLTSGRFCTECGAVRLGTSGTQDVDISAVPDAVPAEWTVEEPAHDASTVTDLVGDWQDAARVPRRRPRWVPPLRDWRTLAAIGLALTLVLTCAWFGYGWLRDRGAHDQLDQANATTTDVFAQVVSSNNVVDLSAASNAATAALPRLESAVAALQADGTDLAEAGMAVAAAEMEAVRAVSTMAEIDAPGFPGWQAASTALNAAAAQLATATGPLGEVDSNAAADVPDLTEAVAHVQELVASGARSEGEQALAVIVDSLAGAKDTEGVRAAAADSVAPREHLAAALAGLSAESGATIQLYVAALDAVGSLSTLDANTLGTWPALQAPLASAMTAAGSSGNGAWLSKLNNVIERGQAALARWRKDNRQVLAEQKADRAVLEQYSSRMDTQIRRYAELRAHLSEWIDHVEAPGSYVTYSDAYIELYDAESSRQTVLDDMTALTVPGALQDEHSRISALVQDAVSAVRSAYSGLSDAEYCVNSCYYADTPGWAHFREESRRITSAYDSAVGAWRTAIDRTRTEIEKRAMPTMPVV